MHTDDRAFGLHIRGWEHAGEIGPGLPYQGFEIRCDPPVGVGAALPAM
jgi:hypothetical protein